MHSFVRTLSRERLNTLHFTKHNFLHIYGFSNVHQQNNHNNWFIYSIHILNQHKSYRTLLSAILNTGLYLHIILYIWIFPRYLLFYSIFDKIPMDKHIYNNNQSLNVQNTCCTNRRYSYRTLYPPFWIYERLPITLYISIKTYYLLFILLEIIRTTLYIKKQPIPQEYII